MEIKSFDLRAGRAIIMLLSNNKVVMLRNVFQIEARDMFIQRLKDAYKSMLYDYLTILHDTTHLYTKIKYIRKFVFIPYTCL